MYDINAIVNCSPLKRHLSRKFLFEREYVVSLEHPVNLFYPGFPKYSIYRKNMKSSEICNKEDLLRCLQMTQDLSTEYISIAFYVISVCI